MSVKVYPHGRNRYVVNKCRCDVCCDANRAYERDRRARIEPAYVAANPARRHVLELRQAGVGLKQIAKVSGVPHGTLSKLIYGDRTRGMAPSKRVRKATLDKILAVTPADVAGGAKLPAGPTWELVDEMVAAGVPKAELARRIGQKGPGLQLSRNLVSARHARTIAELHRRWVAGDVELRTRIDRWGNTGVSVPPPSERGRADVSELLIELAEILEERQAQPWRAQAACRNRPTHIWFPSPGDSITLNQALKVCRSCLVRDECRSANVDRRVGVYGALSAHARAELRAADGRDLERPERLVAHGTNAGYVQHLRRDEPACGECLAAHARYVQDTRPSRSRGAA